MTKQIELWIVGVVAALILFGGYCWLQEHDQRIRAEALVKESQAHIATLEQDKAAIQKSVDTRVALAKTKILAVKTPAQAIIAMPEVTNAPLNARALPDMPTAVAVEAVPLFQELAACRISEAKLDGCTQLRAKDAEVVTEKDTQIKALKSRGSFWHRVVQTAEVLAIGAAVGYLAHR